MVKTCKMKLNYNSIKPTKRQQNKAIKEKENTYKINNIVSYLEKKWNNNVAYTCEHCLIDAYNSVLNNSSGYVTDEELITSSNNTLKHK